MARRLLDSGLSRLGLGTGPLCLDAAGLHLSTRLLGLCRPRTWHRVLSDLLVTTSRQLSFRPSYVVSTGPTLLANLFVYPRYHHYFFGNYYSSRYLNQSIYPW